MISINKNKVKVGNELQFPSKPRILNNTKNTNYTKKYLSIVIGCAWVLVGLMLVIAKAKKYNKK